MALRTPRSTQGDDEDPKGSIDDGRMTLVGHLTEMRDRVIKATIAIVLGGIIGFMLYDRILEILVEPYCDILVQIGSERDCGLVVTDPVEGLSIRMKLSAYVGLVLAMPVVTWQLWRFITPGLYDKEKRYAVPFVVSAVVLFVLGAGLAFWTFPQALEFLVEIGGDELEPFYTPGRYISLITFMMLSFGIGFQFPIVLVFLEIANIVDWRKLSSWRRYAIVIIFAVVAVITPSGDPFTLLALGIPMCIFYEIAILIGRFGLKRA